MQNALKSVPGVRTAEANFQTKEASVTMDKTAYSVEALQGALKKAGYECTVKSTDAP